MAAHMTYDITVKEVKYLISEQHLTDFMLQCIKAAKMQLLAGPYVIKVNGFDPNPGLTGWAVLSTSHISIHTFSKQLQAYIDVFSCVDFDDAPVEGLVRNFFHPSVIKCEEIHRTPIQMETE